MIIRTLLYFIKCSTKALKEYVSMIDRCKENVQKFKTSKDQSKGVRSTVVNSNCTYACDRGSSIGLIHGNFNVEV